MNGDTDIAAHLSIGAKC